MHAFTQLAIALALGIFTTAAAGQQFPVKPVRLVIGFSPGGGTDLMARLIGQKLSEWWGQQAVVENRVGAGGTIGADYVAKAAPDGYTLLLGSVNQNAIAPALYSKLPYDTLRDFAPVVYVGYSALVLVVHPALPVRSVKELIALAKARPGQLTAASAGGNGSSHHLALEMFMAATGTRIINVPYKGSGQSSIDLISGHVHAAFDVLPPTIEHIKQGRLRVLAVTTSKRSSKLPDVPSLDEVGLKGFEMLNWYGFFAPAATPKDLVAKLNADINKAMVDPAVSRRLNEAGIEIGGGTPESFGAYVRAEVAKFDKLVKAAGVHLD